MNNLQEKKSKIHQNRYDKFGFKNGIKIRIELGWWAIAIIVLIFLIWKYAL